MLAHLKTNNSFLYYNFMKRPIFSRGWSDILRNGPTGCYGELFCISDILHLVLLQIFFWLSKVSVTIVKIRITLFWCLWWQTTIIEVKPIFFKKNQLTSQSQVKITIITVTFGVTTPSVGTTTPTTVVSTRDPSKITQ